MLNNTVKGQRSSHHLPPSTCPNCLRSSANEQARWFVNLRFPASEEGQEVFRSESAGGLELAVLLTEQQLPFAVEDGQGRNPFLEWHLIELQQV